MKQKEIIAVLDKYIDEWKSIRERAPKPSPNSVMYAAVIGVLEEARMEIAAIPDEPEVNE